jgi:outer membrane receptor protein involved in Fe transport
MRGSSISVFLAATVFAFAVVAGAEETQSVEEDNAEAQEENKEPEAAVPSGEGRARLTETIVEAKKPVSAASSDDISAETFNLRPHATMQEILNNVPGLIVRQHQGGGKATQYLIRGFNADHGTDFLVTVDGVPVNFVTHGHGQGYADTNFIIPETIETLQLRKGPYFPELGDLAVAGSLNLLTKADFAEDFVLAEGGSFDRMRYVAGVSPRLGPVQTLFAAQAYYSNGPFLNDENFARYNAYGKFSWEPNPGGLLWGSGTFYAGDWDASGQIPGREVSAGRLDRFGSLDATEGGRSDRQNIDLHYDWKPSPQDAWAFQAYATRYKMRLWSDFTFFQDSGLRFFELPRGSIFDSGTRGPAPSGARAIPGDGIEQNDFRYLYGGRGSYTRGYDLGLPMATKVGFESRNDDINVAVHRQVRRNRFFTVSKVNVLEHSLSGYLSQQVFFTDWLRFDGGLRGDFFTFDVSNRLRGGRTDPTFTAFPIDGSTTDGLVSPKANLVVTPEPATDIYLNFGTGFHSNDARGIIQAESENDSNVAPLARALGYEVGARTRRFERLDTAAALWLLDLESEVVFCGDCGTVERNASGSFEPGASTRRWGVDFEARYQLTRWLTADYDLSYADPRFKRTGDAIPVAPTLFMNGGLTAEFDNGFSTAFRIRFLDDRPGNEDRSIPARGYLIMDLFAKYRWKNVEVGVDFLNLADFDWQEAVFVDTSCTAREVRQGRCGNPSGPPEDVHLTPGDPFGVRGRVVVYLN